MVDLRLSIRQTYGQLGMETHLARLDMESPRGQLSIKQSPATMEFEGASGVLEIDSSAAWAALGSGGHLEWQSMIYSQVKDIVLQAIAKTVEDGNRMAAISNTGNAFAEIAGQLRRELSPLQYVGEASFLNVKMRYHMRSPVTNMEPQEPEIEYTPAKVQAEYRRGYVEKYMQRMNSVDIQVSEYDLYS